MPMLSNRISVGSDAPDFTLPNAMGGEISLGDYLGKRCAVLVFLRGLK
jgi:peroxiredoxin